MYKRKRVYAPKRVMRKRRRFARRRRPGRNTAQMNNSSGRPTALGPRSRKFRPKVYRNLLWKNSATMVRVNARGTYSETIASPASLTGYRLSVYKAIDDFTNASNWLSYDGTVPTGNTGKYILRGGIEVLELNTEADEAMDMIVQLVWVKPGCSPAASAAAVTKCVAYAPWATSTGFSNENTKLVKQWKFVLERGRGNFTAIYRPKCKAYDYNQFHNNSDCMFWYVYTGSTVTGVATDVVTVVKSWNVTVGLPGAQF